MSEKAMAPHSSTLAWKIPWTDPGGAWHATPIHSLTAIPGALPHSLEVCLKAALLTPTCGGLGCKIIPGTSQPPKAYHAVTLYFSLSIKQKNIYFCFVDYAKAFDCVDHNKLWKILHPDFSEAPLEVA